MICSILDEKWKWNSDSEIRILFLANLPQFCQNNLCNNQTQAGSHFKQRMKIIFWVANFDDMSKNQNTV